MSRIFAGARLVARRWGLIVVFPALAVCSTGNLTGTISADPDTVADLTATAATSTTITLSFTQVNDGVGRPANYEVRYAVAPMTWGTAFSVASGTCATPVLGTGIGSALTCTTLGMLPSTTYNFQVVAFRGALNAGAVFAGLSNVASASTSAPTPTTPVVTTVTVSPASTSIAVGATTPLQATVKDQNGNVMTVQSVTWSTNNAAAATVSTSGLVTGVGAGSATITATSEGKFGTSNVTVNAVPPPAPVVTTVTVAPASASVPLGTTTLLQATVRDQNGIVMSAQPVTWSTDNPLAATVGSSGSVTGVAAGSANHHSHELEQDRHVEHNGDCTAAAPSRGSPAIPGGLRGCKPGIAWVVR